MPTALGYWFLASLVAALIVGAVTFAVAFTMPLWGGVLLLMEAL